MSPWAINRLSHQIELGAVIAYPGDTIWGFGCHPLLKVSVDRILQIKQRSASKGLILLSSELEFCLPYISSDLSKNEVTRLKKTTTQPTTWLIPASHNCPSWLRGGFSTIAIRITSHPFIKALCTELESPIVSTSANLSGKTTIRNSIQARRLFANKLDYIINGYQPGTGRPSEIQSLKSGDIIRP
jgi:L-threonylcarbamoyladenylate synthase|tara:strand:- start:455 stop:1012 length:558 start_codon:yes stop_codon:yes gene_type:complete